MSDAATRMDPSEIQICFLNTNDALFETISALFPPRFVERILRSEVVFAILHDNPIGLITYECKALLGQKLVPVIDDIFVTSEFMQDQVGERMLEFLEQNLRELGYTVIWGIAENELRLEEWFLRLGFDLIMRMGVVQSEKGADEDLDVLVETLTASGGVALYRRFLN